MKKSITVNAAPETVWNAIVSYRESQPHRRRVISRTGDKAVLEESFTGLPVVGSSRVLYEEVEQPFERIDFRLLEADHLSTFQGDWTIVPNSDGETCEARLTAEIDIDMQIPFKEAILSQLAEMDMGKRLAYVKQTAESQET